MTLNINNEDLVSVIMPCYNSGEYIEQSIQSVLSQNYINFELIIIDDYSSDNSVEKIKKFHDKRIKLIVSKKNGGAGISRNIGIEQAKGRFIAFLDSDDLWKPNKLKDQINFMKENNFSLTYSRYQKFCTEGLGKVITPPSTTTYKKLLYCNVIGCLTAIYDTKQLGKHYMPLIRKRQDMGLWLNILKTCKIAYCYPENLAYYRTDSGMTQNKINVAKYQWIFYREELKLNLIKTLWYFTGYAINGVIRK
ncbi:glycosyltransferase family 2 protein [Xenorhabdus bovienii]|uniref:glycosyltransferase family 2 protein n=1 Tax=Xenorhabdus bovienii TaxID=40576 RepID=UPI00237D155B|nr:glycosyltransferase family 2 protein [Xenorhabdus bovienii]MDE1489882.1 glycosyltransferase [Xenorhabdus bovienii]